MSSHGMTKSYTVDVTTAGVVKVKPSHFLPGYTSLHKATEAEAKQAWIDKKNEEVAAINARIELVKASMEDEN